MKEAGANAESTVIQLPSLIIKSWIVLAADQTFIKTKPKTRASYAQIIALHANLLLTNGRLSARHVDNQTSLLIGKKSLADLDVEILLTLLTSRIILASLALEVL